MSGKASRLLSLREELVQGFLDAPIGIVKFSALMRRAASKIETDEGKRDESTLLLTRGIVDPRAHAQVSPRLLELMEQPSTQNETTADYSRCLLSKAVSSTFLRGVPRYRNEAARRIFFQDLVAISDVVHPLSIEQTTTKLASLEIEKRPLYEMLMVELRDLAKKRWRIDSEVGTKLEQAEKELDTAIEAMERLCGFERGKVGNYRETPKLCSFFDPWLTDDERTSFWGTRHYPILNSLNIQPPYLFFDQLRRGLIARDVARMFMPRVMERMERSYEQCDYCAYKILDNPFESEFWNFARHGLRKDSKRFEGIEYYEEWDAITGGDFIRKMFLRLESIGRFRSQVDLSEYETVADSLALKPKRVMLDKDEIKVLDLMSRDPLASISQLAQKTALSLPTVQRIVRDLQKKANIWPFLVVDTNQFGISGFLLMLKTKTGLTPEVAEEMWKIPYCGRIYRVYGRMDLLAYFNISSGNETFIHEFASQLKRDGIVDDFLWYRIRDFHYGFNPRYYSFEVGEWNVYWDEWGLWLKEYLSTRAWHKALRGEDREPARQVKINKLDLQIINMLRMNARYAFSEIGQRIGVSGAYVGQRVRRLLNLDIVQPKIASFRIGLDDAVWLILDCDDELPMWQGFSVQGDVNGLTAIMYVPTGEVQELLRVLDKYLVEPRLVNDYSFHVIEKWTGMRRWLPIHLYSNEKGWLFEGRRYIEELKRNMASTKS